MWSGRYSYFWPDRCCDNFVLSINMYRTPILVLTLFFCCFSTNLRAQAPLINAHAHNDYEHERPLLDALDQGFISVEADVWYIDGEWYVYHDKPAEPNPERTLWNLYLKPLKDRVEANEGWVYKGHELTFYLMIDIKSGSELAYKHLMDNMIVLRDYIFQVHYGEPENQKPIHVFLSGNRPVDKVLGAPQVVMGLDGRPGDLGKDIPAEMMPVVSDNYWKFSTWRGIGTMKEEDQQNIRALVEKAHAEGKKVRLWAHPDNEKTWQTLIDLGVDLINTDRLKAFSEFMRSKN